MNLIFQPDNPPDKSDTEPDVRDPRQSFVLLLARYKARMYERYGYEIGLTECPPAAIRDLLTNDKKAA